jgi:hypothetical protein
MISPPIAPRIIESDNLSFTIIVSSDIWTLAPIAPRTGQRQIAQPGLSAMLFGDDVVDGK